MFFSGFCLSLPLKVNTGLLNFCLSLVGTAIALYKFIFSPQMHTLTHCFLVLSLIFSVLFGRARPGKMIFRPFIRLTAFSRVGVKLCVPPSHQQSLDFA